jgi:hypothetical protein
MRNTTKKMQKIILPLLLISLILSSCNSKQENLKHMKPLTENRDSVTAPSFKVQLRLSEKAEKELKTKKETVLVDVEFIGTPEKSITEKYKFEYYDENGQVTIGKKNIEITKEREIEFDNCKISKGVLELLKDKTYDVRISVVSGRKSSEDNLLDCDFIQENIEKIKNQNIKIKGKLITEN